MCYNHQVIISMITCLKLLAECAPSNLYEGTAEKQMPQTENLTVKLNSEHSSFLHFSILFNLTDLEVKFYRLATLGV